MLYFYVDVDMALRLSDEKDIPDFLNFFDARLFRTDGKIVEGMYQNGNGVVSWKTAVPGTDV